MNLWYNRIHTNMKSLNIAKTFTSLKSPNFRLWFIGQVVSLVGTWMQATAQNFLVYELTHSAAYLAIVGFANGIPTILFTLLGGLTADRFSKRKVIVIAQAAMMVLAGILAFLAFTQLIQPWHIVVLAFMLGVANSFDAPARQAFVVDMVERENLANAIALNSTIFNLGAIVGPATAGLVYAWLGPAWCFTINSISFIAVIIALLLMKLPPRVIVPSIGSPLTKLVEGLKFVFNEPRIRLLLAYTAVLTVFGFSLMTLMPAWSVKILGGDVKLNGLLLMARGVGSLIGALMIAYFSSHLVRNKIWQMGWYLMPVALLAFAFLRWIPGTIMLLVLLGWCLMSVLNISNALIQSYVSDHMRGRVMSVYTLVFFGSMPIGALVAGGLATAFGEPATAMICAGIILLATIGTFFFRKTIQQF
ncbi:MAG: MFS transporter [Chloroflexi bacterium HGW-Chloroflexi-4]|nr:MAG: MFS transporter [Chloroflexi bacterium HGW-Chloroflexi-4]